MPARSSHPGQSCSSDEALLLSKAVKSLERRGIRFRLPKQTANFIEACAHSRSVHSHGLLGSSVPKTYGQVGCALDNSGNSGSKSGLIDRRLCIGVALPHTHLASHSREELSEAYACSLGRVRQEWSRMVRLCAFWRALANDLRGESCRSSDRKGTPTLLLMPWPRDIVYQEGCTADSSTSSIKSPVAAPRAV